MNLPPDPEELLDAVFTESAPANFGAALLGETIRLAHRRRRWRKARRTTAIFGMLTMLSIGIWRASIPGAINARKLATACTVVGTQKLSTDAIVGTRPFTSALVVVTSARVYEVPTESGLANLHFISDEELLALAAPRLAALVRTGDHKQELIFLVPGERENGRMN